MNSEIPIRILEVLRDMYDEDPTGIISTAVLAGLLKISFKETQGALIYLKEKDLINSYQRFDEWCQKINAHGIDELQKLESEINSQSDHKSEKQKDYDVFICHASEDKDIVARPLAEKLTELGLGVWYDEFSLRWGKSLRSSIDKGLKNSSYGIVVLSKVFFEKKWTNLELDGLVSIMTTTGKDNILPLLYGITPEDVAMVSPILAGIFSRSWDEGINNLSTEVKEIVKERSDGIRKTSTRETKFTSKSQSNEFDLTLDKFTENGNHHVGIRNHKGKTIKSCLILCGNEKCKWWNEDNTYPRHIPEGGAMNVIIPRGFANTNPIIKVMSGDEVIEETHLSEIVHRPATKWNAKDENNEEVERLNTALNRIRSNLATLQNLYQTFLNYPKSVPINDEMKMNLSQKNELVENTQLTVNQASHVLEMDMIQSINDLCALAKKHPYSLRGRLDLLECEHCHGIISQIENLLKYLPNPPI